MKKYEYGDPSMILEGEERRAKGCYSCVHSKREPVDGKVRSFCEVGIKDYPDLNGMDCDWYVRRR